MPTLDDVAREAGVSQMTASNAINGKPNVSAATAKRVLEAARRIGYTANISARRLSSGSSHILGFAAVDLDNGFPARLAADFSDAAAARGYRTIVQQTRRSERYEHAMSRDIIDQLCDGVLLCAPALPEESIAAMDRRIPVVIFDATEHERRFDTIATPCAEGAHDAVAHLIAQGCRDIVVIGAQYEPPESITGLSSPAARRLLGCMRACDEAGVPFGRRQVFPIGWTDEAARACIHAIVESGLPVDGVFCITDHFAHGVYRGLGECGLRIPDDVAVASFDGTPTNAYMIPPLTSVDIDTKEIADRALDRLLERIAARKRKTTLPPERIVTGYRLSTRQSTLHS